MRTAICAAIIDNDKILLVRKRQSWILPGGKPEPNESDIECLCREVSEELSGTQLDNIRYYGAFEGVTLHKGDNLIAKVYLQTLKKSFASPLRKSTHMIGLMTQENIIFLTSLLRLYIL